MNVRVAVRVPDAVGLKTIEAVQLAEAARLVPQLLLEMLKSPGFAPEIETPLIVIDALVPFDSVAACAELLEPTAVLANARLDGLTETVPDVPPVPSPLSATVCGVLVAESLKFNVAERSPEAVGANTIVAVHVAEAARELPQVLLEIKKSPGLVPLTVMPLMDRDDVPLFVSVMAFPAPLFPTTTDTQFKLVGLTEALPDVVDDPVPAKLRD